MSVINGKIYPMWQSLVDSKEEFIGGTLQDLDKSVDFPMDDPIRSTEITDIKLKPNGEDSAFFEITGKDFECGADVKYLGISAGETGWLTFTGYGGHEFRVKKKESIIEKMIPLVKEMDKAYLKLQTMIGNKI